MDETTVDVLTSPAGRALLDDIGSLAPDTDIVRLVSRLRAAGHAPDLVSAVVEQGRLRFHARAKFGDAAGSMYFTRDGLEQATRARVARHHATRFVAAGIRSVIDLGCGIGADARAFADAGLDVLAVDRDPTTAAWARENLAPYPRARVVTADAQSIDVTAAESLWFDPARRSASRRLVDPADWSPPLDWVFALSARAPTGIKLGPGIDHGLIPAGTEAQWISADREVVEVVVWSAALARPGVGRSALVLGPHGSAELTGPGPAPDAEVRTLGRYLVEPDGAVIRARLIGDLARRLHGGMLDPTIAWITTDAVPDVDGLGQAFNVLERYPLDVKLLRREVGPRFGRLEIKTRGVDLDPATLRPRLSLRGEGDGVLILTRVAGQRSAILAERV